MSFAFSTDTKEVLEQVVREPRFRRLTTIPVIAPAQIGLIAFAYGLFGITSYLFLHGQLHWLPMVMLNGFAIYCSFPINNTFQIHLADYIYKSRAAYTLRLAISYYIYSTSICILVH